MTRERPESSLSDEALLRICANLHGGREISPSTTPEDAVGVAYGPGAEPPAWTSETAVDGEQRGGCARTWSREDDTQTSTTPVDGTGTSMKPSEDSTRASATAHDGMEHDIRAPTVGSTDGTPTSTTPNEEHTNSSTAADVAAVANVAEDVTVGPAVSLGGLA